MHKLTGEPASFLGLRDRGWVAQGAAADLCVFDPDTIAPGPLRRIRDFPASGERLVADQGTGVRHMLVNGTPVRVEGESTTHDSRPGRVLRGS